MVPVREWPLWVRYVIAFSVAAALVVALVVYVNAHQSQAEGLPASASPKQQEQENKEALVVVAQQQAPHVAKTTTSTAPLPAASTAVTAYMRNQVDRGFISGPLDGIARCAASSSGSGRAVFRCRITAGPKSTRLNYPFDAVVQTAAAKVTFCQVVTSPDPQVPSPAISTRCR